MGQVKVTHLTIPDFPMLMQSLEAILNDGMKSTLPACPPGHLRWVWIRLRSVE